MDMLTYEALNRNPELLDTLLHEARRERAEAVHRLLLAPLRRWAGTLPFVVRMLAPQRSPHVQARPAQG